MVRPPGARPTRRSFPPQEELVRVGRARGTRTPPLIIGHRCAPRRAPEKTLASFAAALELSVAGVELDVHLSSEGVPVVIHDLTLERTTSGSGLVSDLDAAALLGLDAGAWFGPAFASERIPALAQVVELASDRMELQVEIKGTSPGIVSATLKVLRDGRVLDGTLITSFHHALIRAVHEEERGVRTGILLPPGWLPDHPRSRVLEAVNLAQAALAQFIDPHYTEITAGLVAAAHRHSIGIATWTADDLEDLRRVAAAAVDRLTTNVTDIAKSVLHDVQDYSN